MSAAAAPPPAGHHHHPQWQHPLETGPLTVCGSRPPLLEPLVAAVCDAANEALVTDQDLSDLEIEARLGFWRPHRDSYHRVLLPITSECILQEPDHGKNWRYEFQASVMREQFFAIQKHLEKLAAGTPGQVQGHIRASYDSDSYSLGDRTRPIEIIRKDRLKTINVFSGHYDPTYCDEEKYPLDLRISVNRENKFSSVPSDVSKCTGKRNKTRHSYIFKAWQVDLTEVIAQGKQGEWSSYEVEVELKKDLIAEQLKRQRLGKNHAVYEILTDFIYCVRDLAWMFGDAYTASGGQQQWNKSGQRKRNRGDVNSNDIDFTMWLEPEEDLAQRLKMRALLLKLRRRSGLLNTWIAAQVQLRYLKRVAPVFPIIGDYCFTIAEEIRSPKAASAKEPSPSQPPSDEEQPKTDELPATAEKEENAPGCHTVGHSRVIESPPEPAKDVNMVVADEPLAMPDDLEGALTMDGIEAEDAATGADETHHHPTTATVGNASSATEVQGDAVPVQPNGLTDTPPKAPLPVPSSEQKPDGPKENEDAGSSSSSSSGSDSDSDSDESGFIPVLCSCHLRVGLEEASLSPRSPWSARKDIHASSRRTLVVLMRSFPIIVHLLLLVASSSARPGYPPVYIIRHGEKPAVNDHQPSLELSLRGEIRAAVLSAAFFPQHNPSKYRPIDVVVTQQPSEDFPIRRELHTAQAIISHASAPLRQFKHTEEASLVEYLKGRALAGDVSLLVWEHYRIPAVALTLISRFNRSHEDARHPVWADDRYDILWQLNLDDGTIQQHCMELLYGDLECSPFTIFPPSEYFRRASLAESLLS
ncbi:mRNA-capping enzyme subunit beta [Perkinsus olseni]|uniref:mRNA 5'-phosphatase n=1 Tax=Perkinsus olseni TaxID=32597 RepID=A0A7J6NF41_PEROL|nr:mRNA-capping enzyme subunit beta [Perkinsus olseni]